MTTLKVGFLFIQARFSSNLKSWPKYARGNWIPKVPKPPSLNHAGDINLVLAKVDTSLPRPIVALSKIFHESDDVTKRICSLEMAPAKLSANLLKDDLVQKFQRYPGDKDSLEVKIVNATVFIRKFAEMCNKNTADKVAKVKLLKAIGMRYRLLARLRSENYDRFQYCLKELQIRWVPKAETAEEKRRPTKKELKLKEVVTECEIIKEGKLNELQQSYHQELETLRNEKGKMLKEITELMKQYNIRRSDIFFPDGNVIPVEYESEIRINQRDKWNEAESKNLVRWIRVLQRPKPKMSFLTAEAFQAKDAEIIQVKVSA